MRASEDVCFHILVVNVCFCFGESPACTRGWGRGAVYYSVFRQPIYEYERSLPWRPLFIHVYQGKSKSSETDEGV